MNVFWIQVFQGVENVIFVSILQSLSKTLRPCPDVSGHISNKSVNIFSVNGTYNLNIPSTVSWYFVEQRQYYNDPLIEVPSLNQIKSNAEE